jgi:hypothetical protein
MRSVWLRKEVPSKLAVGIESYLGAVLRSYLKQSAFQSSLLVQKNVLPCRYLVACDCGSSVRFEFAIHANLVK